MQSKHTVQEYTENLIVFNIYGRGWISIDCSILKKII